MLTCIAESCQGENVKLEGRQGQFLTGSVTPPHGDIKLRAQLENGDEASSIELVTDSAGKYRLVCHTMYKCALFYVIHIDAM